MPGRWARLGATGEILSTTEAGAREPRWRIAEVATQEAVYGRLPPGRRESLHLVFARWLEADEGLRAVYQHSLAWHYQQAGRAEKAAGYWLAAARQAMALHASAEALELFDNALAVSDDPRCLLEKAALLHEMGRLAEARTAEDEVIRIAAARGDAALEAAALAARAYLAYTMGDGPAILAHAERALERALASGDRRVRGEALRQVGIAHEFAGRFGPARRAYEELLGLGEVEDSLRARVYNSLGEIARASFRMQEAIAWYEQAQEAWQRHQPGTVQSSFLANAGAAYVGLGRWEYGLALLDQAIAEKRRAGHLGFLSEVLYHRGLANLGLGRREEASADAAQALRHARASGEREMTGVALRLGALTSTDAGAAEAALRESVRILEESGKAGEEARSRWELGRLLVRLGREREATAELARARDLFAALELEDAAARVAAEHTSAHDTPST